MLDASSRLHYVLRSIAHTQPANGCPAHLSNTEDILHLLFQAWDWNPPRYESFMLWAACTLGFFAFLWSGVFTVPQGWVGLLLTPADVKVDNCSNPTYQTVTLQSSKT